MRVAKVVPLDRAHFETITDQIAKIYLDDPLDFLFIGPTGFYVRQVADRLAQRLGCTINRDAFRVINQYVTEVLRLNRYDALVLDRDFYTIYISKVIDELYEEERSGDSPNQERLQLLRTLSKSTTVVSYLVEIFERLWEFELYGGDSVPPGPYSFLEGLVRDTSAFASIVVDVLKSVQRHVGEMLKGGVFDPLSVYRWYIDEARFVEGERRNLVLSGFLDVPPLLRKVFVEMFKKSVNVTFYVWQKVGDRAFEELEEVYEFLAESGFRFDYSLCNRASTSLESVLSNVSVTGVVVDNTHTEYRYVVKRTKDLLLNDTSPDDVAIIVPNGEVARIVIDELEEAKVPYRYAGTFPVTESRVVKTLLQPLKTIEDGFRSEDLLALIESPLVPERDLTMDEVEELFKEYDYFSVRVGPSDLMNPQLVRDAYFRRLDADISKLQTEYAKSEIEEDVLAATLDRLERLKKFKRIVESAIAILVDALENRSNGTNFFEWYKKFILNAVVRLEKPLQTQRLGNDTSAILSNEVAAFARFTDVLTKLEGYVAYLRDSKSQREVRSWSRLYKLLQVLLGTTGFREVHRSANVVEIMDPAMARFVTKRYKLFVDFTDDHYPSLGAVNPLYYHADAQRSRLFDLLERNERRNVVMSILLSEVSELIFPRATNAGDTLVSSKYLAEFATEMTTWVPEVNEFYTDVDHKVYVLRHVARIKTRMTARDFAVGRTLLSEFSHSKLASYLKCPLRFYYENYLGVAKNARVSLNHDVADGIIVHRVLRRFFERHIGFELSIDELAKLIREEYAAVHGEGVFSYTVPRELKVNEVVRHLAPLLEEFVKSKKIATVGAQSLTVGVQKENQDALALVSDEIVGLERNFTTKFGDYQITVRVDRIDRIQRNVSLGDPDQNGDPAFAIVDYKYSSSTDNSQIEQLLLYDFALESLERGEPIAEGDRFLVFLATKGREGRYGYTYLKRIKRPGFSDTLAIPAKEAGKRGITGHVYVDADLFRNWLKDILDSVAQRGDFTPIFVEDEPRNFHAHIGPHLPEDFELQIPEGSKRVGQCRSKARNGPEGCPYERVCSFFEIYGAKLVER